ncbi:MAG TPA: hemerythrin domain-containing protein [Polyangia bacterium]|nr:hemerythrin domain-containing protein [Polyangia bacterium]
MHTHARFDPATGGAGADLTRDHARLDGILDDVRSLLADDEVERAEYVYRDFFEGLLRHVRVEEQILFPALDRHALLQAPTAAMRAEHRRIVSLAGGLKRALENERTAQARAALDALTTLLALHDRRESSPDVRLA